MLCGSSTRRRLAAAEVELTALTSGAVDSTTLAGPKPSLEIALEPIEADSAAAESEVSVGSETHAEAQERNRERQPGRTSTHDEHR